ncbi:MAG: transcription antitermination factor NusB, partial [Deltaproteobacteria bacterium]|nr:transcription antitermination factor NusB [Deltaproteobacteria bacterium]
MNSDGEGGMSGDGHRVPGRSGLMARRRLSREMALQLLFQRDLTGGPDDAHPGLYREAFSPDSDPELALGVSPEDFGAAWPLALELYLGVCRTMEELDAAITGAASNWRMDRMGTVERSLLRLAYFEMVYREDVPVKASLNEAVELAKGFGNADSQAFVNGVLDRLARELDSRKKAGPGPGTGARTVARAAGKAGAGETVAARAGGNVPSSSAAAVPGEEADSGQASGTGAKAGQESGSVPGSKAWLASMAGPEAKTEQESKAGAESKAVQESGPESKAVQESGPESKAGEESGPESKAGEESGPESTAGEESGR